MSAIISDTVTLNEILKPTGYIVPESRQDMSFNTAAPENIFYFSGSVAFIPDEPESISLLFTQYLGEGTDYSLSLKTENAITLKNGESKAIISYMDGGTEERKASYKEGLLEITALDEELPITCCGGVVLY